MAIEFKTKPGIVAYLTAGDPDLQTTLDIALAAIDNGAAREVWALWQARGAVTDVYTFEDLDTRHDIIEPATYPAAAQLVYPVLLQLLSA